MVTKMTEGNESYTNKMSDEQLEIIDASKKIKKLLWTWVVGSILIVTCILYGDTAQLVLAGLISIYIYVTTRNYLKYVASINP